ncbi:hypothetical protein [Microtetraspora malaysiensis]|uniref:hypothetical protein n=1 Tax=Microtetraspora malaysiensis TaxID=161358 RepID=UPI003D8DDB3B
MIDNFSPQKMLLRRILSGEFTDQDVDTAQQNFERWIREEWKGAEHIAGAYCMDALEKAAGPYLDALSERDKHAHIWLFMFQCPRSVDPRTGQIDSGSIYLEAIAYRDVTLRSLGGFAQFAQRIRFLLGWTE